MTAEISKVTPITREDFSHYLAGLIEGDGTIYVPKDKYSVKGKKNYPSIQIAFNQKDVPLAMAIVRVLGAGTVAKVKGKNALILTVNSKEGVQQLVELLNGKMRTPKIKKLKKLID